MADSVPDVPMRTFETSLDVDQRSRPTALTMAGSELAGPRRTWVRSLDVDRRSRPTGHNS